MSKRQTEDSSHRSHKKTKKTFEFRTAVSQGRNSNKSTNSLREPGTSRLTSTSTVVTLSRNEGGRRRGSGRYRHREDTSSISKEFFPPPDMEAGNVPNFSEMISGTGESDVTQNITQTSKAKRSRNNNNSVSTLFYYLGLALTEYLIHQSRLQQWIELRQTFLEEFLRHDGRGDFLDNSTCFVCKKEGELYKCEDCTHGALLKCQGCTNSIHFSQPFHRIKVKNPLLCISFLLMTYQHWNGQFFDKTSLRDLGLQVQLGHSGGRCPCPERGPQTFTVFALSGVHHVDINYCGCHDEPVSKTVQILRQGWFPASFIRPQTAFTFDCLSFFHELTLQGKVNVYDFYHTLLRVTDNPNLSKTVVSVFFLFLFISEGS